MTQFLQFVSYSIKYKLKTEFVIKDLRKQQRWIKPEGTDRGSDNTVLGHTQLILLNFSQPKNSEVYLKPNHICLLSLFLI